MLIIKPDWEPIYPRERKRERKRERERERERESSRDQQIAKQDLKDYSRAISSHGVPLHPPPNAGVYDACIVRLFVLLDLDWLARGRGGACRIANVTTWVQYEIVFLQILVSLASHRRVSIFTCTRLTRCYNNALISLIYNLSNENIHKLYSSKSLYSNCFCKNNSYII